MKTFVILAFGCFSAASAFTVCLKNPPLQQASFVEALPPLPAPLPLQTVMAPAPHQPSVLQFVGAGAPPPPPANVVLQQAQSPCSASKVTSYEVPSARISLSYQAPSQVATAQYQQVAVAEPVLNKVYYQ